ncbi:uncharacterized protein YFR016C-like [Penaeus japonicus]|uniref:uncharacterized protein YFR016C-like n=1 Tax=Penaeus japonicus TaxID=27405 RepID=UPI001C712CC9|nr:uncharacterized protein YFR016C-like [Penaeus japonicus]
MAAAASVCLAVVLLVLARDALAIAIPEKNPQARPLPFSDTLAEPRFLGELFDPNTEEFGLLEAKLEPESEIADPKKARKLGKDEKLGKELQLDEHSLEKDDSSEENDRAERFATAGELDADDAIEALISSAKEELKGHKKGRMVHEEIEDLLPKYKLIQTRDLNKGLGDLLENDELDNISEVKKVLEDLLLDDKNAKRSVEKEEEEEEEEEAMKELIEHLHIVKRSIMDDDNLQENSELNDVTDERVDKAARDIVKEILTSAVKEGLKIELPNMEATPRQHESKKSRMLKVDGNSEYEISKKRITRDTDIADIADLIADNKKVKKAGKLADFDKLSDSERSSLKSLVSDLVDGNAEYNIAKDRKTRDIAIADIADLIADIKKVKKAGKLADFDKLSDSERSSLKSLVSDLVDGNAEYNIAKDRKTRDIAIADIADLIADIKKVKKAGKLADFDKLSDSEKSSLKSLVNDLVDGNSEYDIAMDRKTKDIAIADIADLIADNKEKVKKAGKLSDFDKLSDSEKSSLKSLVNDLVDGNAEYDIATDRKTRDIAIADIADLVSKVQKTKKVKKLSDYDELSDLEKSSLKSLLKNLVLPKNMEREGLDLEDSLTKDLLEALAKPEEARQDRDVGTLSELTQGPDFHHMIRSNEDVQISLIPSQSNFLLDPLTQSKAEGMRRKRSVFATNSFDTGVFADRLSRYEREAAEKQRSEDLKKIAEVYFTGSSLGLKQGRSLGPAEFDLQEQSKNINTEFPKTLENIHLKENRHLAAETPKSMRNFDSFGEIGDPRKARELMAEDYVFMTPELMPNYNMADAPDFQSRPVSGRAADSFWYGVSPGEELKAVGAPKTKAVKGVKNIKRAEGKAEGRKLKDNNDSNKEAKNVSQEVEKRAYDIDAMTKQKKNTKSDAN